MIIITNLHSNLVIFKLKLNNIKLQYYLKNLHSNLVIFKYKELLYHNVSKYQDLHSNLVIFKSSQCVLARLLPKRFTFQSGDIQIDKSFDNFMAFCIIYIPIW